MPALSVEVEVAHGLSLPLRAKAVEEAVRWTLQAEGVEAAELSLAFLPDAEIAGMNEQYLSHPGPTDVITFPLHAPGAPPVGDVYIGLEQAERQARDLEVEWKEEVLRLAIHGTLHVLGYDHPEGEDRERSPMYLRQEELLGALLQQWGGAV